MEKQKKVLDASVIIKWFTKEENTDKAIALREEHKKGKILITVPEILFAEVLNSLRYKKSHEHMLKDTNKALWDMEFEIKELTEGLLVKSILLAQLHNITIYDAIYVAVAHFHGAPFITADTELAKIPGAISLEKV
jgi:predicted nucleic acid-binding protein